MPIRKDARLHMEGMKIANAAGLNPGDIVSALPGLWSNIGLVCQFADERFILFFDITPQPNRLFENLVDLKRYSGYRFAVIPASAIVPLIDSDTFDVAHPGRNGIAIVGDRLACVGWKNSSYFLFDAKDGTMVTGAGAAPAFISSWDLLTKDADDTVVSLLEVRPD